MEGSITAKVRDIVGSVLDVNPDGILDTESFSEVCVGFDDLDRIDIILLIEGEFSVDIDVKVAEKFDNIAQIVEHLKNIGVEE